VTAAETLRAALAEVLPAAAFREPDGYLSEPRGLWHGHAACVVAPASVDEVAEVIRSAARTRTPVVPWGGGTGLVGGQVKGDGAPPIVLSLERMRAVRAVYPDENALVVEAGAVLSDVQRAAEEAGRLFPLSLGSQGSARIGGLLATNAGGVNVLRYGTARELTLGIEAVMPDGSVLHGLRRLRKDNTGYDLRHLLIGSEGTLGVITAAALRLFPRPQRTGAALLVVPDPRAALRLLGLARDEVGEGLSAFELISGRAFAFLAETGTGPAQPFAPPPDWSVLIDLGLSAGQDPDAALERIFAAAAEAGLAYDGVIAQSETQRADLWALRELIPEANRKIGAIASHDVSLPLGAIPDFLDAVGVDLAAIGPVRANVFGHLGDGNVHYNVFPPAGDDRAHWRDRAVAISHAVHEAAHRFEGSFSAEHGVGRLKTAELLRYGDPAKLAAMRAIKAALDPLGIMNPGAVLPER
jgi:FAD/FMN-containing dehydrogenase